MLRFLAIQIIKEQAGVNAKIAYTVHICIPSDVGAFLVDLQSRLNNDSFSVKENSFVEGWTVKELIKDVLCGEDFNCLGERDHTTST